MNFSLCVVLPRYFMQLEFYIMASGAANNVDVNIELDTFSASLPSWLAIENGVSVQEGSDGVTDVARVYGVRGASRVECSIFSVQGTELWRWNMCLKVRVLHGGRQCVFVVLFTSMCSTVAQQ